MVSRVRLRLRYASSILVVGLVAGGLGATPAFAVPPDVTGVASSSPNGVYRLGDTLSIQVAFDQAVTVDTSAGTPTLALETGTVDADATYVSGSGSTELSFTYTVGAGQLTGDLDVTSSGALALNGATVRNIAAEDADLTLPAPGAAGSLGANKNLIVDGAAPSVGLVSVPAAATYTEGQSLDVTVSFTEPVLVDSSGGVPFIPLQVGTASRAASYLSGSGTPSLLFRYTVVSGDEDADGVALGAAIVAAAGALRDAAGNDADATLSGVGATGGVRVDAKAPTAVSFTRLDPSPTDAATLRWRIVFSEPVLGFGADDLFIPAIGTARTDLPTVTAVDAVSYTVTVEGVAGEGKVGAELRAPGTGITDVAGNPLVTDRVGDTYDIGPVPEPPPSPGTASALAPVVAPVLPPVPTPPAPSTSDPRLRFGARLGTTCLRSGSLPLRFSLSRAARVELTIIRLRPRGPAPRSCATRQRAPSRVARDGRVGTVRFTAPAGDSRRLYGLTVRRGDRRRRLPPGTYLLVLRAVGADGQQAGAPARRIRILPAR